LIRDGYGFLLLLLQMLLVLRLASASRFLSSGFLVFRFGFDEIARKWLGGSGRIFLGLGECQLQLGNLRRLLPARRLSAPGPVGASCAKANVFSRSPFTFSVPLLVSAEVSAAASSFAGWRISWLAFAAAAVVALWT
jgi:hypothetical protein